MAFAPATIGNVSVGFDILGLAISGAGDTAIVTKTKDPAVRMTKISGTSDLLPKIAAKNTAGAAVLALQKIAKAKFGKLFGFEIELEKGIPMGSGMGGSAASAVAAVVAANLLLPEPLSPTELMSCALAGESMASGGMHPDNIAPCLFGGLTLSSLKLQPAVVSLPLPDSLHWVLVHPDIQIETKAARGILRKQIALAQHVDQSARLAAFVSGFFLNDKNLIRQGFQDQIIEPQRQHLIPGFAKMKQTAESLPGVLGFSISGSGPSVFALTTSATAAHRLQKLCRDQFRRLGIASQSYRGKGAAPGARAWRQDRERK